MTKRAIPQFHRLEPRRFFAAGDLDATFGLNGRVETTDPGDITFLNEAAFLPDGKVLVSGEVLKLLLDAHNQYLLKRFNADGTPDDSFGDGGVALGTFTTAADDDSSLLNIAITPDGKIYGIGTGGADEFSGKPMMVRFNSDGSLDTTFGGGDGNVAIGNKPTTIVAQHDGKLIVHYENDQLIRYNADGSVDTTFGGDDAIVESPLNALTEVITFQGNKILVGGTESDSNGITKFALARLNSDGSLDTSFGTNGKVVTAFAGGGAAGTAFEEVSAITFLPGSSGKFLVAGEVGKTSVNKGGFVLMRYSADGTLDTNYGDNGFAAVSFGGPVTVNGLNIDASGNAMVTGYHHDGVAIARVTASGQLDDTFGRAITSGGDNSNQQLRYASLGATIQSDGKLLVVGEHNYTRRLLPDRSTTMLLQFLTSDTMPSPVSLNTSSHVLSLTGTGNGEELDVLEVGDVLQATRDGVGRAFATADVDHLDVTAGGGNDLIQTPVKSVPAHVSGGAGKDRIAGTDKNDTLEGNGARDLIDGGNGADRITGGGGNDGIRGQGGADHLYGGPGDDTLVGNSFKDFLSGGSGTDSGVDDGTDILDSIEALI